MEKLQQKSEHKFLSFLPSTREESSYNVDSYIFWILGQTQYDTSHLTSSNLLLPMISRRQTREYLLQTLYARVHLSPFDRDIFYGAYFLGDHSLSLDMVYLDGMEALLIANE